MPLAPYRSAPTAACLPACLPACLQLGVAAYLAFGLKEPVYAAVLLALILPQVGVWLCGFGASVSSPGALKLIASSPLPRFPPSPNRACPCASSPINTQVYAQIKYFLPDPVANDVKYQASAQPFLVFGLLTTGLAVGAHNSGAGAAVAAELLGGATGSGLL